jgi:hypothetical protein
LFVVGDCGGEREPIGVVDAPIRVEEDNDDFVEGLPYQGLSQMEVVRLPALDMTAGDSDSLPVPAPQVVAGATTDLDCLERLSSPFARSFMRV